MTTPDALGRLLLELELDVDRKLLDAAPLTGITAERWAPAAADLLAAWDAHARAQTADAEQALAAVERAAAVVREAGRVWESLTPRLASLGPGPEHDRLMAALRADPLGFDAEQIDALEEAIELREQGSARLAAAHALLDEVEEAQRAGETAHHDAVAKITGADVRAPGRALSELAARLRAVEALVGQEVWHDARRALAQWTTDATRELEHARDVAEANRAPIEQRDRLRGLLKAYEAKARGVRALESDEIAALFARAEQALYRAPVDLAAAGELVARYGRELTRHQSEVVP